MTQKENAMAILNYQPHDNLPVVAFGYWKETLVKWANEGHITSEEAAGYARQSDNSEADKSVMRKLGFDFNWSSCVGFNADLFPHFEREILEERPDGCRVERDECGLIILVKPGVVSIPSEIGTTLTNRSIWEAEYLPKMQWSPERLNTEHFKTLSDDSDREVPLALNCGSLIGTMRNFLGVEQLSYLYADDEELFAEIIKTFADLSFQGIKAALETGAKFDYAHYWEDICFKNGPLVSPSVFNEYVGPYYKRNSELLNSYGINIISLDCDGLIDSLIPTWIENGVNTMFPIEVGTWGASIAPWREKYGRELRGVGGMNKTVFSRDYKAVDEEIERLRPLIALGGYIPCPDHRIPPDAEFANVQYYCEQMRKNFG